MTLFKVCFVGLGSIAKRHITNLNRIFKQKGTDLQIDLLRHSTSEEKKPELVSEVYFSNSELPNNYDSIFITNPTFLHYEALNSLLTKTKSFFIEKPVFTLEQVDWPLPDLKDKICYVACPLRYTPVINYLKDFLNIVNVYNVRAISSSFLPDWRPQTDYRNTYSANKKLGGGVSIDLIHEWDYLQYLFGFPQKVSLVKQKVSNLEIDTEDSATYLAQYPNMTVELHLDYFGKYSIRELMLICDKDTLRCDLIEQKIDFLKSGKQVKFDSDRNIYQTAELEHFLNIVEGKSLNTNNIELAKSVLKLTNGEL